MKRFESSPPAWADAEALSVVVLLYDPASPTLASGTVVAPDLILTAEHVALGLASDATGWNSLEVEGRTTRVRVEAHGDVDAPHGDWALLRLEAPRFERFAPIHAPALDPSWSPKPGTEFALAGFALGFYAKPEIDVLAPTPAVTVHACEAPADDALVARSNERARAHDDPRTRGGGGRLGDPGPPRSGTEECWYASGDRLDLGGMSGGAAWIRDPETGRPELVGVFSSLVHTRVVERETTTFFGLTIATRERATPGLVYTIHRVPPELPALLKAACAR
ncbi:MAG: trypsin-like peptidase domain-containing protein [Planctomycetes bacterium]|nr:trypsin-like peptidase domain-containing protein [Planctomycetota bacterium]